MANQKCGQSFFSFLFGVLVGGLVGAGVGILWAPQSGERTREQILQTGEELQSKAELAYTSAKHHGEKAVQEFTVHAEKIKEEAKQAVDAAVEESKAIVTETKKIAKEGWKAVDESGEIITG